MQRGLHHAIERAAVPRLPFRAHVKSTGKEDLIASPSFGRHGARVALGALEAVVQALVKYDFVLALAVR